MTPMMNWLWLLEPQIAGWTFIRVQLVVSLVLPLPHFVEHGSPHTDTTWCWGTPVSSEWKFWQCWSPFLPRRCWASSTRGSRWGFPAGPSGRRERPSPPCSHQIYHWSALSPAGLQCKTPGRQCPRRVPLNLWPFRCHLLERRNTVNCIKRL